MKIATGNTGAGALLIELVALAGTRGDATALLHHEVCLTRLDGTRLTGRDAVVDAVSTRDTEATLTVIGQYAESIHVQLQVNGVPGRLVFMMSATVTDGALREIWME